MVSMPRNCRTYPHYNTKIRHAVQLGMPPWTVVSQRALCCSCETTAESGSGCAGERTLICWTCRGRGLFPTDGSA